MHLYAYEFMLALRRLWRRKTQSGLMFATFTISITLSLLSWSIFHTMFVKQPDYDPAGELAIANLTSSSPGAKPSTISREDFAAWQEAQTVFSEMAPISIYRSVFIARKESAERFLGALMSSQALRMLGAKPLLGRLFDANDDKYRCAPVLMLSELTWRRRFHSDPAIIGQAVRVDGYSATIVGVLPESFRFPNSQEVWLPLGFDIWFSGEPDDNSLDALVRLKPGVSVARAMQDLGLILARRGPGTRAAKYALHPLVTPAREYYLNADMRSSAIVLMALSLIFVLVSCANAANLVMIDFFGRSAELAATLTLGLPRAAAVRGLVFQVVILASAASLVALGVLVVAAPHVHQSFVLMLAPYWLNFTFSWHHIAMALGLGAVSAGVAIIAPAAYLLLANLESLMRAGAGASRGTGRNLWRRTLIVTQLALLTVLGISAALLARSNRTLDEDKWGYDASRVFLGKLDMPRVDFPNQPERLVLFRKILDELSRLPGMRAAAITDGPPGYPVNPGARYALDPATLAGGHEDGQAVVSDSSENIFEALGVPLLQGSKFPSEFKDGDPVWVIINASLAARMFPGQDPIGQGFHVRFRWMEAKEQSVRAVVRGVVRDYQAANPQRTNNDVIMLPFRTWTPSTLFLVAGGTTSLPSAKEITDTVWRVDPRVVPYFPDSIKHQIDMQLGFVRLTKNFTVFYALAAVFLCAVGVYSITVAQILQRNREFGIRMALGIEPDRLWRHFVRGHLVVTLIGIGVGLALALVTTQALKRMLYRVDEHDPLVFASIAVVILVVSLAACIPSRFRLQRIKPSDCLRSV
ncbi:MAG: permease [Verrucomicrobia bacterium]|nr:permease [Verrucomicrobiota bacterium]